MAANGTATKAEALTARERHTVLPDRETRSALVQRKPPKSEGVVVGEGIVPRASVIGIDEIYRAPEASTKLGTALRLLREAVANCDDALSAIDNSEPLSADSSMLKVRAAMPELFCCRAIGDGFAEVVNSAQSAFENLDGELFSAAQVRALREALAAARNQPRMSFEKSVDYVSTLEEVGLKTELSEIDRLAGFLDD